MRVVSRFDKAVAEALAEKAKGRLTFKVRFTYHSLADWRKGEWCPLFFWMMGADDLVLGIVGSSRCISVLRRGVDVYD